MQPQIEFKKVNVHPESLDSRLIWKWRNDPVTCKMSRDTELVPWETHKTWYMQKVKEGVSVILIASINKEPTCMIRFDYKDKDVAEINVNMNPTKRGNKWSTAILLEACRYGFAMLHLNQIYAEIKPENKPSVKIFEAVGFVLDENKNGFFQYHLNSGDLKVTI